MSKTLALVWPAFICAMQMSIINPHIRHHTAAFTGTSSDAAGDHRLGCSVPLVPSLLRVR